MTRLPQLEDALVRAARRSDAAQLVRRRAQRPVRTLAVAVIASLAVGGIAVAATQLVKTGGPVPRRSDPAGMFGAIAPATTKLLSVRVADPGGGPPWGLRVYRTTMNEGAKRDVGCVQVGRVVDGRLGVLGQDGSFNNDGNFHELPVQPDACGGLDAHGQLFVDAAPSGRAANADPEAACSSDTDSCPSGDRRTITYGLAGALAQQVTLSNTTTSQTLRPTSADSGAYLLVLAGGADQHRDLKVQTSYPNGVRCSQGADRADTPGCSPPPGYVVAHDRQRALARQFNAFSERPLDGDASFIPGVPDAQNEIDPGTVRLARSGPWRVAIATSGSNVCLSSVRAGQTGALASTCAPQSTVASAGLFLGVQPAPGDRDADATYYVGLLPDGVGSVRVIDAGAATTTLAVTNNIITAHFSSPPRKLQFTDADGAQHSQTLVGAANKGAAP